MGVLASVTGLVLGLGLAKVLFKLFDAVGFTLPNSGIVFATSTVVIALVVGVVVTVLASLRPALRATRVPPIAAVREGATLPVSRFARFRTLGSAILTVVGFAALLWGLFGSNLGTKAVLSWMGIGAVCVFFGVALLSVRIIQPLAGLLGWPATADRGRRRGARSRQRAPEPATRTASTAAALMIGLALVTLVAVLAAGITSSFRGAVEKLWKNADYAITAQNNFSPIPIAAAARPPMPCVEPIGNVRTGNVAAFGKTFFATAVNPGASTMFKLDWKQGSQSRSQHSAMTGAFRRQGLREETQASRQGRRLVATFSSGRASCYTRPRRASFLNLAAGGGSPFGPVTNFEKHVGSL